MLPTLQVTARRGWVDFSWGQPGPDLLPHDAITAASDRLLSARCAESLGYGANRGPGALLEWLRARLSCDGREPETDEMAITPGVSQALDSVCSLLAQPGSAILVESPTYDLALRLFRERGLIPVPVGADVEGLLPEELAATVDRLSEPPAFLYLVPTFNNPTGVTLADGRRKRVLEIAASRGLWVVEDDVYRELSFEGAPPPSLWATDESQRVIRLGSFSKCLAPGLRVGWMTGPPAVVEAYVRSAMLTSSGGASHFAAALAGELCAAGEFEPWIAWLRSELRSRRDALCDALDACLPEGAGYLHPKGGYFVWLRLPAAVDAAQVAVAGAASSVGFAQGLRFSPYDSGNVRLSFAYHQASELTEGAERLAHAIAEEEDA